MAHNAELRAEREYMARVQQILYAVISQSKKHASFQDETIRMMLTDAWDELRMKPTALSPQDLEQLETEIDRFLVRRAFSEGRAERYERMLLNPYFARVDFREDGEDERERIVIGLYSLKDETGKLLVHDWRAPVCSLYYDAMPGRAGYACPSGVIEGELSLKRQYATENGRLKYYVDTEYSIDDSMLLDILSGATTSHMRQIVATIQKEQNDAIRCERARVMSVVGCAGSGKTSVALHRAAYLMYRHRDQLSAARIAVLSPSGAFSEYISNVLPELGEDNVAALTLHQIVTKLLDRAVETHDAQHEAMLAPNAASRVELARFKASDVCARLLEEFVNRFTRVGPPFSTVSLGERELIGSHELARMYAVDFRALNPAQRLTRIAAVTAARLAEWERSLYAQYESQFVGTYRGKELEFITRMAVAKRLHPLRAQLKRMLQIKPMDLYAAALRYAPPDVRASAEQAASASPVHWEDAVCAAYLTLRLGFAKPDPQIYQLLVDEAQDYADSAFRLLELYYPNASVTILGDPNQRTLPALPECDPQKWGALFGQTDAPIMRLTRGYRCTVQIGEFLKRFLPPDAAPDICGRAGDAPKTLDYSPEALAEQIARWKDNGRARIAVITRARADAERVAAGLPGANLLTGEDDEVSGKPEVTVGAFYLTKGLEFDAVAVVWPGAPRAEDENRRLYTACSRALHELALFYEGQDERF